MKKSNLFKKMLAVVLALVSVFAFVGCNGGGPLGGGKLSKMYFLCAGTTDTLAVYNDMVEEFNKTVGKDNGFEVKVSPKPQKGYETFYSNQVTSSSGADVLCCLDESFKAYSSYYENLTNLLPEGFNDQFVDGLSYRYHYNVANGTASDSDPIYAVPVYNNATVLYYNKTALKAAGVVCISVDEDDIDDFNNGGTDNNGKTKADYGISNVTVLKKGFYRSGTPYVKPANDHDGSSWVKPASDEIMIFNERISMNWNEIEDLAMLTTKTHNASSTTDYGYYTEWWFNHGWTVGGDCLEDLTGNGDWVYTHASPLSNYIVKEGKTYVGTISGDTYSAGETIDFCDILGVAQNKTIVANNDGTYSVDGSVIGVCADVLAKAEDGVLSELPSTREAFSRFAYLAGVGGLNVCPIPTAFVSTDSPGFFTSGKLAMLLERSEYIPRIERDAEFEWGIAEIPQYKEYTEQSNPNCDTTVVVGKKASHSMGTALVMRKGTKVKDRALIFIKWMATAGQTFNAKKGVLPTTKADLATFKENYPHDNAQMLIEASTYETAGDWWYLKDGAWINTWADPLNIYVRYGQLSLDEFFAQYVGASNDILRNY